MRIFSKDDLSTIDVQALNDQLRMRCTVFEVPTGPINYDTLNDIGQQMGELCNLRSYLLEMKIELDVMTRTLKSDKSNPDYQRLMDLKKVTEGYIDLLDTQSQCMSRMITIYQCQLKEINMY